MKDRSLRVARHEAAHAVVAHLLGATVKEVKLTPEDECKGYTIVGNRHPADPMEVSVIALAGVCAEEIWYGVSPKAVSLEDHMHVVSFNFRGRSLATLRAISRGLVKENRRKIDAVARALRIRDLTGEDVKRIIKKY